MPNRVVCSVLEEMRQCHRTRSYGALPGLIEEVQSMVNRMEAALWDQKDHERLLDDIRELKKKAKKLRKKEGDSDANI